MANPIVEKAKERMTQSHQSLGREFGSIRAGQCKCKSFGSYFRRILRSRDTIEPIGIYHHSRSACLVDHTYLINHL